MVFCFVLIYDIITNIKTIIYKHIFNIIFLGRLSKARWKYIT